MRPDLGQQNCKFISRYIKYSKYIFGLKTCVTNHVKAYLTFLRHIQKLFLYFERQKFHYHICEYKSRTKNNLPEYVALINRNPIIDRLNSLQVIVLE